MGTMTGTARLAALAVAALAGAAALGGCSTTGGTGAASLSLPATASLPPSAAEPPPIPVNYGAFLGGPAGSKLPEADRKAALAAENGAVGSGERRSWKGAGGVYGYVVPGPSTAAATAIPADGAPAECRSFTSTIFFGGRPTTGKGTGCRDLDGDWHVTS